MDRYSILLDKPKSCEKIGFGRYIVVEKQWDSTVFLERSPKSSHCICGKKIDSKILRYRYRECLGRTYRIWLFHVDCLPGHLVEFIKKRPARIVNMNHEFTNI